MRQPIEGAIGQMNRKGQEPIDKLDRRSWSMSLGSTLGMIAFSSMLRDEGF